MIQLLPRTIANVNYTDAQTYWAVMSGENQLSDTFGPHVSRAPMPWAATVRNLVLYTRDAIPQAMTVTVFKNLVGTGLTVTLPAGQTGPVYATGVDVSFAQGDDICYETSTPSGTGFPGYSIAVCLEIESEGNVFGVTPIFGTYNVNEGGHGGALGNGQFGTYTHGDPVTLSGSYSICAIDGAITTLVLKTMSGAPGPGESWIGFLVKEGVIQDGSGGTVDTRCTIAAGQLTAVSTFTLPMALGERVDVAFYRTGAVSPFGTHVCAGIGFEPDEAGHFMITGGTSATVIAEPTGYTWPYGGSAMTSELLALAPIGPSGLVARGLYVERQFEPGVGYSTTHTLRRNEQNTLIAAVLSDLETSKLKTGFQSYVQGDTMALRVDVSDLAANGGALHWGLDATVTDVGPPASSLAVIGPHIWIVFYRTQPEIGS